jgi:predicted nucleotidyltransferase/HEPN domain-containing protein
MKTAIDHLPATKQRELERIVEILFDEFELAQAAATGKRQAGRILKVVLFGSYARGGWVDEPHTAKGYQSDYDLLLIVNQAELTDRVAYWANAEERLIRELSITRTLRTPVNFIVHTLQEVNDGLAHGRYFFMDIAKDGVALYESDDSELHQPKPKTPEQALSMAKEYFEEWLPRATSAQKGFLFYIAQGESNDAAFLLHQATERLYHSVLLVLTSYTPHVHNIAFLRSQAERLDARLIDAWPRNRREDRAKFEKLKDAYVKGRYSKHYKIDAAELEWLGRCVEQLGQLVHALCSDRIALLEAAVRPPANGAARDAA